MSIVKQKSIVNQFFLEVLKEGKLEILDFILDSECLYIDGGKLKYSNREDFIEYVRETRKPYTTTDVVVDDIIAEGDRVATRCTYHLETKRDRVTVSVMGFFQFFEGKIVKIWRNVVVISE
jgi:predicted SnoaL-like aldol condensation-catalyzing enzyme